VDESIVAARWRIAFAMIRFFRASKPLAGRIGLVEDGFVQARGEHLVH
jgi:hypothetical protein